MFQFSEKTPSFKQRYHKRNNQIPTNTGKLTIFEILNHLYYPKKPLSLYYFLFLTAYYQQKERFKRFDRFLMTMASLNGFDGIIRELLTDVAFVSTFKADVIQDAMDDDTKKGILKAALKCIFGGPTGVRTMPETKSHMHIKNNKNWRPFCASLLAHLTHKGWTSKLEGESAMFLTYGSFWPTCDKQLKEDVEKARAKAQKN